MEQFRQGDVFLEKVSDLPAEIKQTIQPTNNQSELLIKGESRNHGHFIEGDVETFSVEPTENQNEIITHYLNVKTGRHTLFEPVVHKQHCTGCGICEKSCVLDRPAIVIGPLQPASQSYYEG